MSDEPIIYVRPIDHDFDPGDEVIDITAEREGWQDVEGVVRRVDGSHVEVKYTSGNIRAKMHINIRKKNVGSVDTGGDLEMETGPNP